MKVKKIFALSIFFLLLTGCIASIQRNFTQISFRKWSQNESFVPFILSPLPLQTCLKMGPLSDSASDMIQLHYTESDLTKASLITFELYESSSPLAVGKDILPMHNLDKHSVQTENKLLMVGKQEIVTEIRVNEQFTQNKVAIFELDGTHIAFSWENVADEIAYKILENNLSPLDLAITPQQGDCP